jgi:hypothetical protein
MADPHCKLTIMSMAVISAALASLLHEGLGHGVTAWLRGDVVTELTSNHLSTIRPDRLVDAGGTLVNLFTGALFLFASRSSGYRANLRYFLWFLGSVNLLEGAGYFLFSGVLGLGDWAQFMEGFPHQAALRTVMAIFGAALYAAFVRLIAASIRPFVPVRRTYNTVGRLPYYTACVFSCLAGAFDPLGIKLLFLSTIPAAFGGLSGFMWADNLMPRAIPSPPLVVRKSVAWWGAALVLGLAFIAVLGRGITFKH